MLQKSFYHQFYLYQLDLRILQSYWMMRCGDHRYLQIIIIIKKNFSDWLSEAGNPMVCISKSLSVLDQVVSILHLSCSPSTGHATT